MFFDRKVEYSLTGFTNMDTSILVNSIHTNIAWFIHGILGHSCKKSGLRSIEPCRSTTKLENTVCANSFYGFTMGVAGIFFYHVPFVYGVLSQTEYNYEIEK